MNNIKKALVFAAASGAATFAMATPVVSDVTMTQNSGRKVTITYKLSEDAVVTLNVLTNATPNAATGWASIGGEAICNAQGAVWRKVTSADADGNGNYLITWHPDQSWKDEYGNGFKVADGCAKAVVTAWSLNNTPNYMVVDISSAAQPNTQRYYPAEDFLPGGLLGCPDYRQTTLVMRKIMAKDVTWTMGSATTETGRDASSEATFRVSLTNNYYIGVFPITQSQWGLVATNSSVTGAFTTEPTLRAMESVCYNEIRLKSNSNAAATSSEITNYSWPKDPNPSSFLGLLRLKTGIDFDLPSEAQWEFAARAGNGSGYWGNSMAIQIYGSGTSSKDNNLNLLGRYNGNCTGSGVSNNTAIVGTYLPNDWGLYDMFGNVLEWCLDWYEVNITSHGGKVNINPANPANNLSGTAGSERVRRGGSWYHDARLARPAARNVQSGATRRGSEDGFRVVCTAGLE